VLRLYDMGAGALVGMVIMPQRKIEMAMARGSIAADDLKIDGWPSAGRRFRWMRTDSSAAGRTYAAYGGVYICASLAWLGAVEGIRPDRWDALGAAVCLVGAAIILFGPRSSI
jgi:hypothetical protein